MYWRVLHFSCVVYSCIFMKKNRVCIEYECGRFRPRQISSHVEFWQISSQTNFVPFLTDFVPFVEKSCMYHVLWRKLENVPIIGSSYMNQNQFLRRFSRFSAFIRFLFFFFEQRNPHKLNILSTEAEEIGQARISRIELNRYRNRI